MNSKIRVLLADDHQMLREAICHLLKAESDIEVIAESEDGRVAVQLAQELAPDVVVMDINMPNLNGMEATRQIRTGKSGDAGPQVIALSAQADAGHVSRILQAGAMGYVAKVSAFQELVNAVRSVAANKLYLSPTVARLMDETKISQPFTMRTPLSERERETLQLLSEGKATKEVAMILQVSVKTAETHRRNLMIKLGVDSVAEMTKHAIREGITSLD